MKQLYRGSTRIPTRIIGRAAPARRHRTRRAPRHAGPSRRRGRRAPRRGREPTLDQRAPERGPHARVSRRRLHEPEEARFRRGRDAQGDHHRIRSEGRAIEHEDEPLRIVVSPLLERLPRRRTCPNDATRHARCREPERLRHGRDGPFVLPARDPAPQRTKHVDLVRAWCLPRGVRRERHRGPGPHIPSARHGEGHVLVEEKDRARAPANATTSYCSASSTALRPNGINACISDPATDLS